ncbi:gamma-glutamyltransferase [Magnetospirillum sp. LM-5]|uniref:gamma-glutamyltransferase n=1 Tax=Magnetospirillum sp. LM-5 TaxID=2681466 RepID=UPI00353025A3
MRVSKPWSPSNGSRRFNRAILTALLATGLSACFDGGKPVGTIGYVKGFGGVAVADEPRAVLVARDVLSAGGTAADAMVAMYFTMSVTLPSTASLGGGGVCVVHDKDSKTTEALEFMARPSAAAGQARVPTAVPANVRGFYALHAKYGKMRWEGLLNEAEKLARLGTPTSRAFANDFNRAAQALSTDPGARRLFFPDNRPLAEGQELVQFDLASLIARVRRSPGDFYTGTLARDLVQAVSQAGGSLTPEDLRAVKPEWVAPMQVKVGHDVAHFAPPPAVAGAVAAQLTAALVGKWADVAAEERPHLMAEASARAFSDRARWMRPDGWPNEQAAGLLNADRVAGLLAGYNPARHVAVEANKPADAIQAAGLLVMDGRGNTIACNVSTNGLFGIGKVAPGTGMVLAASPGHNTGPAGLGPVVVVNPHVNEAHFAASPSGGITAPTALTQVLLAAQVEGRKLPDAVAAPRVHHSGNPDTTAIEPAEQGGNPEPLTKRGHEVRATPIPARVNALQCDSGKPGFTTCRAVADPRGAGLSAVVGKD